MSWEAEVEALRRREALTEAMGGADKVERQHYYGKLTIRERLDAIVDRGTFHEIGKLAGAASYNDKGELQSFMPASFIFGTAEIEGRPVIVSGDDFTGLHVIFRLHNMLNGKDPVLNHEWLLGLHRQIRP